MSDGKMNLDEWSTLIEKTMGDAGRQPKIRAVDDSYIIWSCVDGDETFSVAIHLIGGRYVLNIYKFFDLASDDFAEREYLRFLLRQNGTITNARLSCFDNDVWLELAIENPAIKWNADVLEFFTAKFLRAWKILHARRWDYHTGDNTAAALDP